jgi:hypothetical protein
MRPAWLLCVASALVAAPGCRSTGERAAAGTERYQPVTGNLRAAVSTPLDRVWAATQAAVDELEFRSSGKSKDALSASLIANGAVGTEVRVRLERRGESLTEIIIGVGPFGRRATADALLDRIKSKL